MPEFDEARFMARECEGSCEDGCLYCCDCEQCESFRHNKAHDDAHKATPVLLDEGKVCEECGVKLP